MNKDGISIVMAYHDRKPQLLRTLESINNTSYNKNKLEIIIVNDNSSYEHKIDDLSQKFNELNLNIINISKKQKKWVNCCIPFNIGFSNIKFDKVIIQNPECYHMGDIISDTSNRINNDNYLTYASYSANSKDSLINDFNKLELKQQSWQLDPYGRTGWYNHSIYKPTYYHFCSSITYNNLSKLNGFDERYKDGIGYDDDEFVHRIKNMNLNMIIIDYPFVLHQYHESVFRSYPTPSEREKYRVEELFNRNKTIFNRMTLINNFYVAHRNIFFNKNIKNNDGKKKPDHISSF